MKKFAAAAALVAALVMGIATSAGAKTDAAGRVAVAPPITYGVSDDGGKYSDTPATWLAALQGANLTQDRWTLQWDGSSNSINELAFLQRAAPVAQAMGVKIILALYGPGRMHDPTAFCAWAANVAATAKQWGIHDFIVWNEPNTGLYFASPDANVSSADYQASGQAAKDYEPLLAACYDSIHAADSAANVIGFALSPRKGPPTQSYPLDFVAGVAAAYKASPRSATLPLMDQMSIHPYPNPDHPIDSPDIGYPNVKNYGIPNLDRVKQWVYDGFHGTKQIDTTNGLTFLIDELGWQTNTTAYPNPPYYHDENVSVVEEQTQADFIQETVQKYFACDPTVVSVNYFLLMDEQSRDGKDANDKVIGGGWQSGFMTPDGKAKISYTQDARYFPLGRNGCSGAQISWTPTSSPGNSGNSGNSGDSGGTTPGKKPKCKRGYKTHLVAGHWTRCRRSKKKH
jgi:hypothetical protein